MADKAKDAARPRYYDASKNPDGAFIPGVPLADLTAEAWDALPKGARADAEATGWYRLTPAPSGPAPEPDGPPPADAPAAG